MSGPYVSTQVRHIFPHAKLIMFPGKRPRGWMVFPDYDSIKRYEAQEEDAHISYSITSGAEAWRLALRRLKAFEIPPVMSVLTSANAEEEREAIAANRNTKYQRPDIKGWTIF